MSRRNKRRHVAVSPVKEIDTFDAPYGLSSGKPHSNASRLINWIITGNEPDRSAMFDLFPLPGNVRNEKRV